DDCARFVTDVFVRRRRIHRTGDAENQERQRPKKGQTHEDLGRSSGTAGWHAHTSRKERHNSIRPRRRNAASTCRISKKAAQGCLGLPAGRGDSAHRIMLGWHLLMGIGRRLLGTFLALALIVSAAPQEAWAQPGATTNTAADEAKRKGDDAMVAL